MSSRAVVGGGSGSEIKVVSPSASGQPYNGRPLLDPSASALNHPEALAVDQVSRLKDEVIALKSQLLQLQASITGGQAGEEAEGERVEGSADLPSSLVRLARLQESLQAKMAELKLARNWSRQKKKQPPQSPPAHVAKQQKTHGGEVAPSGAPDVPDLSSGADGRAHIMTPLSQHAPDPKSAASEARVFLTTAAALRRQGSPAPHGQSPSNGELVISHGDGGPAPSSTARRRLQQMLGIVPSPALAGSITMQSSGGVTKAARYSSSHTPTANATTPHRRPATSSLTGFVTELESPSCASPRPGAVMAGSGAGSGASHQCKQQSSSNVHYVNNRSSILSTPLSTHLMADLRTPSHLGPAGAANADGQEALMSDPAELPPTARKPSKGRPDEEAVVLGPSGDGDQGDGFLTPQPRTEKHSSDHPPSQRTGGGKPSSAVVTPGSRSYQAAGGGGAAPPRPNSSSMAPSRFSPEVLARATAVAYPAAATLGLTGSLSPDCFISRGISQDGAAGDQEDQQQQQEGGGGGAVRMKSAESPAGGLPSSVMVTPYVPLADEGRRLGGQKGEERSRSQCWTAPSRMKGRPSLSSESPHTVLPRG